MTPIWLCTTLSTPSSASKARVQRCWMPAQTGSALRRAGSIHSFGLKALCHQPFLAGCGGVEDEVSGSTVSSAGSFFGASTVVSAAGEGVADSAVNDQTGVDDAFGAAAEKLLFASTARGCGVVSTSSSTPKRSCSLPSDGDCDADCSAPWALPEWLLPPRFPRRRRFLRGAAG